MQDKHQILFIKPGPVLPPDDHREDEYISLSKNLTGDILIPVWGDKLFYSEIRGNFKYHLLKTWGLWPIVKQLVEILFYVFYGLKIFYLEKRKFAVILVYGTNTSGIGALILKILTGAKLITEIPGNPSTAFILDIENPSLFLRLKHAIANLLLVLCVKSSSTTKLLYPDQLNGYPTLKNSNTTLFHALTHISHLQPSKIDDKFIFFLGYPWFLKGVDILLKAFNLIKDEIPNHQLIIAGHCEDRTPFEALANQEKRITFLKGLPHDQALEYMSRCSLFVLPSRTESMGKVLLESMGFSKPVIGSRVDGIPMVIRDGYNGYLFESENYADLANKIKSILLNPELAKTLGANGRQFVTTELSEDVYIKKFNQMIRSVITK